MNQLLAKIGAAIVTVTVILFAVFIICDFSFGSYVVCMFLPIGILAYRHFSNGVTPEKS